jgi:AAA+ ATPase superfamily predicted ATPase
MMLPLPFLSKFLVLLARQDRNKGQEEIIRVATKTNQQRAARIATLQLAAYDLSQCKSLKDISLQQERLSWFMSASSPLSAQSKEALGRLDDVIREIVAATSTTSDYIKQQDLQRVRTKLEEFQTQFVPTGLAGKEVSEFSRVAEVWIQIVKQELDKLAQRRIYERIPNPYVSGPPVSPGQKSFVGRREVFKFIEDNLVSLYQANTLVLFGPRRIGKTSILVNLSQYLPHNFIPVDIDMQGVVSGIKNSNEFFYLIAKAIHDKLQSRYGLKTKDVLMDEYEKKNPFILFGEFLDDVEKVLTDRYKKEEDKNRLTRLLICLDEFEEIDTKIKQGVLEVDIIKQFRNIMQHRERIVLLFTGMHTLEEMSKDYWSVFFGATRQLKISYLDKESAKQLITKPIPEFPLTYDDAAVERIISQTRCHPYLLQETCFNLVFYLNKQEREPPHATLEDVEKALEMTQEKLVNFFEGLVWGLAKTPEARAVLVVLSSGKKSLEELEEELEKNGIKITKSKLLDTLKRLADRDLIEQIKDKDNKAVWQFQIELARRWVSQGKSMEEVRV